MINLSAQYALRAIVHIAGNNGMHTADTIAQKTGIPRGYLAKILQRLHQSRLVETQRGKGGGYALANEPARITVLEVVRAIEPREDLSVCDSCQAESCRVASFLRSITDDLEDRLRRTSLDEFLQSCSTSVALTGKPEPAVRVNIQSEVAGRRIHAGQPQDTRIGESPT